MQANTWVLRHNTCVLELPAAAATAAAAAAHAADAASLLAQARASQLAPSAAGLALAGLALLAVTLQDLEKGLEEAAGGPSQREPQRAAPFHSIQAPRQLGLGAVHWTTGMLQSLGPATVLKTGGCHACLR